MAEVLEQWRHFSTSPPRAIRAVKLIYLADIQNRGFIWTRPTETSEKKNLQTLEIIKRTHRCSTAFVTFGIVPGVPSMDRYEASLSLPSTAKSIFLFSTLSPCVRDTVNITFSVKLIHGWLEPSTNGYTYLEARLFIRKSEDCHVFDTRQEVQNHRKKNKNIATVCSDFECQAAETAPRSILKRDLQSIKVSKISGLFLKKILNLSIDSIPLVEACRVGFSDGVEYFVNLGAKALRYSRCTFSITKAAPETALRLAIEQIGNRKLPKIRRTRDEFKILRAVVESDNCNLKMPLGLGHDPPIFICCKYSNVEIAAYLCEHGASVLDRNDDGLTCLMLSRFFRVERSRDFFKFLIDQGLSVDATTPNGRTALHYAVENDNVFLMKLLLAQGAKLIPDGKGQTPLSTAALTNSPNNDMFLYLYDYATDERLKKDALLLKASSSLLKRQEDVSYLLFRKALEMNDGIEEEIEQVEPNPAYDSLREARSLEEVEAAEDRSRFIGIQCLIMRERILGQSHPEVLRGLVKIVCDLNHTKYDPRNYDLCCYTLDLAERYGDLSSGVLVDTIDALCPAISHTILDSLFKNEETSFESCMKLICYMFDKLCLSLEKAHEKKVKAKSERLQSYSNVAVKIFSMVQTFCTMKGSEKERKEFPEFNLRRFVKIATMLHISVFDAPMFEEQRNLIPIFVNVGANINETNKYGQTVLMKVTESYFDYDDDLNEKAWPLLKSLISNGSRIFVRDRRNGRVFEALQDFQSSGEVDDLIALGGFITLKDMCAEVVETKFIPAFLNQILPRDLREFTILGDKNFRYH
ncbi:unnamed protein product [Caenorhabditis auriculariae]|uniref:ANK_REP_REGION domain-containing protein n=1 Tax=Caenorhabditis auriculariae TaxID=2777116 RepID=A0A8S1H3S4_9PELO|nr:unnamed protein product [Caenorhabditis auriculariae]